jgi:hypothetical protein
VHAPPILGRAKEGEGDESVGERKGEKKRKDGRNKGGMCVCVREGGFGWFT